MTYYQNAAIADITTLFSRIETQLAAEGWTAFQLNTTTGAPGAGIYRRETIWRINGSVGDPAKSYVGMFRKRDNANTYDALTFYGMSAVKGWSDAPIQISTIGRASNVTTVVTVAAHGLATNDRVILNCVSNENFNNSAAGQGVLTSQLGPLITVTNSTTFTYTDSGANITAASATGYVVATYNGVGERSTASANGQNLVLTDTTLSLFMYADPLRACIITIQSGNYIVIWLGEAARAHIPVGFRDRALTTDTTGTGSVSVALSRTCSNLAVGQYIWLIHPSAATFERVLITARADNDHVTVTLANSYPVGSIVGEDPMPLGIVAPLGSLAATLKLDSRTSRWAFFTNGTRTDNVSQNYVPTVVSAIAEANLDPDSGGYYQLADVWLARVTAGTEGTRGPMLGVVASALGIQNNQDLMRVGPNPPADDYKVFVSPTVDGTWVTALGPGAIA